jgi:dihydroflavonol-4-reductase
MGKVLITGATGFLGAHVLQQSLQAGMETHVFVRSADKLRTLDIDAEQLSKVQVHLGDLLDADSVQRAMRNRFDVLFNIAADTNTYARHNARQTAINVDGMRHVIAAARGQVGRIIDTSSTAVFGLSDEILTETSPKLGLHSWINYAQSKAQAEELLLASGLEVVILNPSHLVGPGDRHNWARLFALIDQQKLPGAPGGSGSFADVRQVAQAHLKAIEHGVSGHNYLLGGEEASFLHFCQLISKELGQPPLQRKIPAWLLMTIAKAKTLIAGWRGVEPEMTPESAALTAHHMRLDISKAKRDLGLQITPLPELVADTVQWLHSAGLLLDRNDYPQKS